MVKEGLKLLEGGYSARALCSGLEKARLMIDESLKASAKVLTTQAEIAQVGTISANGDSQIGSLIAQAMSKVGRNGIITVEEAKGMTTSLDVVEGMQFDRGYLSPYFVTNPEKMHCVYSDARVLVTDKKLSLVKDLLPILERSVRTNRPLFIIADDVEGEALQALVLNKLKANLQVVAIKAPGYGKHRDELLSDICVLTGARLVSSSTGLKMEEVQDSDLGTLKRVSVDAKTSTLVGTGATADKISEHIFTLKSQLNDVTLTAEEIVKLKTRIAKLSSGVAVIKVGGATEVEMIERKYRIEDALNATKAAADEGIVPGGGMALVSIVDEVKSRIQKDESMTDDEKIGASIAVKACYAPLRRIVENAGLTADVVLNDISRNPGKGYNAATGEYVDMLSAGVIDPVKVSRTALKSATSVAVTFLSLDAVVVEEEIAE